MHAVDKQGEIIRNELVLIVGPKRIDDLLFTAEFYAKKLSNVGAVMVMDGRQNILKFGGDRRFGFFLMDELNCQSKSSKLPSFIRLKKIPVGWANMFPWRST